MSCPGPVTSPQEQKFREGNYLRFVKPCLDFIFSLIMLPFVLIALAIIAPAIYFEDKGPVFYNAPRVGKGGQQFVMYKFRSMRVNAPDLVMADGSTYNGDDDPRMTKVGRFLRKTSLDELPQFFNVLKGDMSIIGPRPDLQRETELYEGNEHEKLYVRPGITGYSAVMVRNSAPWHERLKLDVYYVRHVNFCLDCSVFFQTFAAVFSQKGIYISEGQAQSCTESSETREKKSQAVQDGVSNGGQHSSRDGY